MSITYQPQHRFDLVPSPVDHRDYKLEPPDDYSQLPANKMLPSVPPTRDQGQEGSCWGFSGSGAHQNARNILGLENTVLSPAFLYWNTRKAMGDTADDTGSDLRTGLDTLLKLGNCAEEHMPYVAGRFMDPPLDAAYTDAINRTIKAYHRLTSVNAIRYAIALNLPVVFGIPVYQQFEEEGSRTGYVDMPKPGEQELGGHAIQCIGYYTSPSYTGGGIFVLLNSWGPGAGDHGKFYLPWAYMTALSWTEAWSLTAG